MRNTLFWIIAATTLLGCPAPIELEGRACPCTNGYVCCAASSTCMPAGMCSAEVPEDGGTTKSDGGSTVEPMPEPDYRLSGTAIDHHVTDTGVVNRVNTAFLGNLQVFSESGGVFTPLAVHTTEDGKFWLEDGPAGALYVRMGSSAVVAEGRKLNLDQWILGRPETVYANYSIPVSLSAQGLVSGPESGLTFSSSNTGAYGWFSTNEFDKLSNTTSVSQLSGSLDGIVENDPAQGDTLTLLQSTERDGGTYRYDAVAASSTVSTALAADAGIPLPLNATFTATPQQQITLDVRGAELADLQNQLPAQAQREDLLLTLTPAAGGLSKGWLGYSGDLMNADLSDLPVNASYTFQFGNPFPPTWTPLVTYFQSFSLPFTRLPGTTSGGVSVSYGESFELSKVVGRPLTPRIGPVRNVRVNGAAATTAATLSSLTPRIQWDAPTLGQPSSYTVTVYELSAVGTRTQAVRKGTVSTSRTSIFIPPGMLVAKRKYVLKVDAATKVSEPEAPFEYFYVDVASASSATGVLTTP